MYRDTSLSLSRFHQVAQSSCLRVYVDNYVREVQFLWQLYDESALLGVRLWDWIWYLALRTLSYYTVLAELKARL